MTRELRKFFVGTFSSKSRNLSKALNLLFICDLFCRAVASDSRSPWFKSSHRRNLIMICFLLTVEKTETKKEEAWNGPLFKLYKFDYRCHFSHRNDSSQKHILTFNLFVKYSFSKVIWDTLVTFKLLKGAINMSLFCGLSSK